MRFAEKLEWGVSFSVFGRLDEEDFKAVANAGIKNVELSYTMEYYFDGIDFVNTAEKWGEIARKHGVKINSIHLPFEWNIDISHFDKSIRDFTLERNSMLIEAAEKAEINIAVLHPSSEPIEDCDRAKRLEYSKQGIITLAEKCEKHHIRLGVENLPRTCLCRNYEEHAALLESTGAGVIFDTNHALTQDNVTFINGLAANGLEILSLHISDYYRNEKGILDEKHVLPGEGINNWNGILDALEKANYKGPLMYEVRSASAMNAEGRVDARIIADNMKKLSSYQL